MERKNIKAQHADNDETFVYALGPSGTNAFQTQVQSSGADAMTLEDRKAIGRIFCAAFNSATACEDMGYDGEACVKALPDLVKIIEWAMPFIPNDGTIRTNAVDILTRCRG